MSLTNCYLAETGALGQPPTGVTLVSIQRMLSGGAVDPIVLSPAIAPGTAWMPDPYYPPNGYCMAFQDANPLSAPTPTPTPPYLTTLTITNPGA